VTDTRPLTEQEQAAVLTDFEIWSGGFLPAECDERQLRAYCRHAADAALPPDSLCSFLTKKQPTTTT
jgi:hypothetical protein